jgi:hypothetical protein
MSLWSRLLGRRRPGLQRAIELVGDIAKTARTLSEYRRRLSEAAQAGDLDDAFSVFNAANRRAEEYIERG